MTDIDKQYQEDIEYLEENHSKEMQEYKKIGNRDNFNKIIEKLEKLSKYKVALDDFYGLDAKAEMRDYLEGKKYTLEVWFEYDIVDFEMLEAAYKAMKEIKEIIDEVIGG